MSSTIPGSFSLSNPRVIASAPLPEEESAPGDATDAMECLPSHDAVGQHSAGVLPAPAVPWATATDRAQLFAGLNDEQMRACCEAAELFGRRDAEEKYLIACAFARPGVSGIELAQQVRRQAVVDLAQRLWGKSMLGLPLANRIAALVALPLEARALLQTVARASNGVDFFDKKQFYDAADQLLEGLNDLPGAWTNELNEIYGPRLTDTKNSLASRSDILIANVRALARLCGALRDATPALDAELVSSLLVHCRVATAGELATILAQVRELRSPKAGVEFLLGRRLDVLKWNYFLGDLRDLTGGQIAALKTMGAHPGALLTQFTEAIKRYPTSDERLEDYATIARRAWRKVRGDREYHDSQEVLAFFAACLRLSLSEARQCVESIDSPCVSTLEALADLAPEERAGFIAVGREFPSQHGSELLDLWAVDAPSRSSALARLEALRNLFFSPCERFSSNDLAWLAPLTQEQFDHALVMTKRWLELNRDTMQTRLVRAWATCNLTPTDHELALLSKIGPAAIPVWAQLATAGPNMKGICVGLLDIAARQGVSLTACHEAFMLGHNAYRALAQELDARR